MTSKACRAVGHKVYALVESDQGWGMSHSKYAPDEIRNSIYFCP